MLNERNMKLMKEYGPQFIDRSGDIDTACLHLGAVACSVMTDAEWKNCAESMIKFIEELHRVRELVANRMEENGIEF